MFFSGLNVRLCVFYTILLSAFFISGCAGVSVLKPDGEPVKEAVVFFIPQDPAEGLNPAIMFSENGGAVPVPEYLIGKKVKIIAWSHGYSGDKLELINFEDWSNNSTPKLQLSELGDGPASQLNGILHVKNALEAIIPSEAKGIVSNGKPETLKKMINNELESIYAKNKGIYGDTPITQTALGKKILESPVFAMPWLDLDSIAKKGQGL